MKNFLRKVILDAGEISLDYRQKGFEVSRKSAKDLVTEADRAVEKFLTKKITEQYPSHGILGEEYGSTKTGEYCWVIDPIDGTSSFVHGHPFYSISIALQRGGETILGAVYAPVLDELFTAEKNAGAFLNCEKIQVSPTSELIDVMAATGFACIRAGLEHNNLKYFNRIIPKIRGIRRCGSAAIDLSYVACGRYDVFWELNLKKYDFAAGALILEEAGGKVTGFDGKPSPTGETLLATNSILHRQFLEMLNLL
ncbi:Inositol-1-monophosphatase [Limihaloglobus sulfuriphilus]|uniref:Inositol-1-monophosphatase n=1 Tax=Limihaloglobus sulfuriphilus TaxID=1851148 RepID=A0A1Q2MCE0_9BACT|nr:inositol monophosphatase family protein [Limihaloglobus sulfuriphilus]AQQ70383.1 Inositol-1-monophosphatase [Limihaloglobus sulfuriphilus]